ncbi:uncharacterized protein TNCV_2460261 [Trichonephila clavipes]|nr:uncharacterized protein TNCV_2460261 [Trichonephila clavipes]
MDVCKRIMPLRHGGTLNSLQAAGPLVRVVEGEDRWEASDHPQSVLPPNWGGIEPNRTVTSMVLKATANDWRHLALCHDKFRGLRSRLCRSATNYSAEFGIREGGDHNRSGRCFPTDFFRPLLEFGMVAVVPFIFELHTV